MPPAEDIRVVAFDLDNTLWAIEPVMQRAELRLLEWLRERWPLIPERFSLEQMRAARYELSREHPDRAHDFTFLRTEAMARHARECGYEVAVAEEAFEIFFAARNEVETFDDVAPALERLASRYVLATLSNGNADLARIGLADRFAVSLNACGIGAAKPELRCFEALADRVGVALGQIAYVGDDPYLDVEGARCAGLLGIWMNRFDARWPAELPPPRIAVRDCAELASRLLDDEARKLDATRLSGRQRAATRLDDEQRGEQGRHEGHHRDP